MDGVIESLDNEVARDKQYLNMPDLETESPYTFHDGVEILAQFDTKYDIDQGITKKVSDKQNEEANINSLNCFLPTVPSQQCYNVKAVCNLLNYILTHHQGL